MFCSNCGSPQQEDAKFCSSCGTSLQQKMQAEEISVTETASTTETTLTDQIEGVVAPTETPFPPEHGLSWSLFLTPIAGAVFWSKNWNRLGKPQHIWWTWVTGMFALFSPGMFGASAGRLIYLVWAFFMYFLQRSIVPKPIKSVPNTVFSSIWAAILFISIFFGNSHTNSIAVSPDSSSIATTSSTKDTEPSPAPTPPPAPKEPPVFTLTSDGTTYKGVEVSNVGVALYGVDSAASIGDEFYSKKADGKFVIINVLVENNQNDAITLNTGEFTIIDNKGRQFTASVDGLTAYQMTHHDEKDMLLDELNPGVTTKGFVVFDVPANLDIATSNLEVQGGFTGEKAQIPLAVQKQ